MGMVKLLIAIAALSALATAQSFTLSIGNATAAKLPALRKVGSGMAVRVTGCSGEVKLTGVAVRSAGGTRATTPLTVYRGEERNVWGAANSEATSSPWLAVITGQCGSERAGVIVPFDARGLYNRDKAKFLTHAPTSAEIDAALKELD